MPGILLLVAAIWPWLDRSPADSEGVWFPRQRRRQNLTFILIFAFIIALILIDVFLRGPYWHLYWPGTSWPTMPRTL